MKDIPAGFLINGFFIGSEVRQMNSGPSLVVAVAAGVNSYQVNMAQVYDVSHYKMGDPILISCRPIVTKTGSMWVVDGRIVA